MKAYISNTIITTISALLFAAFPTTIRAGESWDNTNGKAASSVLGQADFAGNDDNRGGTPTAISVFDPFDVAIDPTNGKLFVADAGNHRVLRFSSAAAFASNAAAEAVLGQSNFTTNTSASSQNRMKVPSAIAFDRTGRLWVVDSSNHRVLRFDNASSKANGANADGVLGQINFTDNSNFLSQNRMDQPQGVAVDSEGNLYVADTFNNRVLRFDNAANKANGANADGVLGQSTFGANTGATSQSGMKEPRGIDVDTGDRLWVTDSGNNRVLRFDGAPTKANGGLANGLLGQSNFNSDTAGTVAGRMSFPLGISATADGTVWVCEQFNHRILRFENAVANLGGGDAQGVIGQADFTSGDNATGLADRLSFPGGIFADNRGNLWVTEWANDRVIRFQANQFQPDGLVGKKRRRQIGNRVYNSNGKGQTAKVKMKGKAKGEFFFTTQNDGDQPDVYSLRATKGNRKIKAKYFRRSGGNVTGAITSGRLNISVAAGGSEEFETQLKSTSRSRGRSAGRTFKITSVSDTDREKDVVKAKVKKTAR